MRQARLTRTAGRLEEAQNKAHERSIALTEDINRKTDRSLERSLQANRELEKQIALENSVLGRQGKNLPEQSNSREVSAPIIRAPRDKESMDTMRSIVSKRREQPDPAAKGADSLPPNVRKALERGNPANKNDTEPRLRVQENGRAVPRAAQSKLVSQGISTNIAEEARRRKRLEAHIHQLAAQQ